MNANASIQDTGRLMEGVNNYEKDVTHLLWPS